MAGATGAWLRDVRALHAILRAATPEDALAAVRAARGKDSTSPSHKDTKARSISCFGAFVVDSSFTNAPNCLLEYAAPCAPAVPGRSLTEWQSRVE